MVGPSSRGRDTTRGGEAGEVQGYSSYQTGVAVFPMERRERAQREERKSTEDNLPAAWLSQTEDITLYISRHRREAA